MTPSPPDPALLARIESGLICEADVAQADPPTHSLAARLDHYSVRGLSLAVIDGGKIAWAHGWGVKEAGQPDPVTPETLFQAASISKPVTALLVMRLAEVGLLDLDADVNDYLVSWRVPPVNGWQPRLTLRQLLSHTAGTTVHGFLGYPQQALVPTLQQVLNGEPPANSDPVRVDILPGVQMRYSGGGTTIAQQVLDDATGEFFPALMRQQVLEPLGMTRSTFAQPLPEALAAHAATAHYPNGHPVAGRWHVYPEQAAAGLWTTPTDLARFAIAVQRALAGEPDTFISAASARAMLMPQAIISEQEAMGLGFVLEGRAADGTYTRFSHGGGNYGFRSYLVAHATNGQGAVVMNNGDWGGGLLNMEVLRAVAVAYGWPGFLPEPVETAAADMAALVACAGTYTLESGLALRLEAQPDGLTLHLPDQPPLPLQASSDGVYRSAGLNATLRIEPGDAGGMTLVLAQGDATFLARLKPD